MQDKNHRVVTAPLNITLVATQSPRLLGGFVATVLPQSSTPARRRRCHYNYTATLLYLRASRGGCGSDETLTILYSYRFHALVQKQRFVKI